MVKKDEYTKDHAHWRSDNNSDWCTTETQLLQKPRH